MMTQFRLVSVVCLVIALAGRSSGNDGAAQDILKALDPSHPTVVLSPDRKYRAIVQFESGTVETVSLYRNSNAGSRRKIGNLTHFGSPLTEIIDVDGFLWLPGHSHTLVFASCGVFGTAMIGLFTGGSSIQPTLSARHPHADCFRLYGYARSKRKIIYGYAENYVPQYTQRQYQQAEKKLRKKRLLPMSG